MTDTTQEKNSDDIGFFYRPQTIQWILRVLYGICVVLVLMDFIVHRHTEIDLEKFPAFYAIYGFVACVILVWLAAKMRTWVIRSEDYYEAKEEGMAAKTVLDNAQPNQHQ